MNALQARSNYRVSTGAGGVPVRVVPRSWGATKRTLDVVLAATAILVSAPILLVAMIGVSTVSGGSPIFAQERVGRHGRRFRMFKLRTMVRNAHAMREEIAHLNEVDGPVFKIRKDPRLHSLGAFLRRTSIDELPNFLNVLLGDMSIVGPRPPLPSEVEDYDDFAMRRLTVKPGITCLWQISGRCELSFERWMALDNEYIETWSPLGDLAIIAQTVPAIIRGTGAH